jgi:iron(III) transport system permease protein
MRSPLRIARLVPSICVAIAAWLVIVPVGALLYTAFTADAVLGDATLTLDNFADAYSGWHILRLFGNSLVYAVGTAAVTLVMGGIVAWVVERTDAPGGALFHVLALMSFAIPGLLMAMAWIFIFSPNIGWGNAAL